MKPGAFVCIVTNSFRLMTKDHVNELVDFPGHTITAFKQAGFYFWQKVALIRNFGSAAQRADNSWKVGKKAWAGKKLVPSHEELLVFRTP